MTTAKQGDTVLVHFTGKLADGSVFDCSDGRQPLELELGKGRVIPGVEDALVGMCPGDTASTTVEARDAFGDYDPELVFVLPRDRIPADIEPQVEQRLELKSDTGKTMPARIIAVSPAEITVDANHPLAGKDLQFDLELVSIVAET